MSSLKRHFPKYFPTDCSEILIKDFKNIMPTKVLKVSRRYLPSFLSYWLNPGGERAEITQPPAVFVLTFAFILMPDCINSLINNYWRLVQLRLTMAGGGGAERTEGTILMVPTRGTLHFGRRSVLKRRIGYCPWGRGRFPKLRQKRTLHLLLAEGTTGKLCLVGGMPSQQGVSFLQKFSACVQRQKFPISWSICSLLTPQLYSTSIICVWEPHKGVRTFHVESQFDGVTFITRIAVSITIFPILQCLMALSKRWSSACQSEG